MARVLVADALSPVGVDHLRARGLDVEVKTGLSEADLVQAAGNVDALIVRSATTVTRTVFEAAANLKVVARAGVGVDNVDTEAATDHGVLVVNAPMGNTVSAAEHTFALLLSLARRVPQAVASLKAGQWDRKAFAGVELSEKTLGVIGMGRIGREVAARARAFGMRVVAFDPFISKDVAKDAGVALSTFDDLLAQADFVTVHVPLTPETENLLDAAQLAKLRPTAYVLNVARGGIIDEGALTKALKTNRLAGAAVDVFAEEPPTNAELIALPNFIGTPHLGASTAEAQEKVALAAAKQVADYLLEGTIVNAVNMPHPVAPALQPYVELAQGMGAFAAQLAMGQLEEVAVTSRGEIARHDTRSLSAAALAGVLSRSAPNTNLINAQLRAKEHGIRCVETKTESIQDYASSVELVLRTESGETTLLGTSLQRLGPRIVALNGYEAEFKPSGRFLVVHHQDEPGTVAKISTELGRANINIAQMVVGRMQERGPAVSILRVDDPVPAQVLEEIRAVLNGAPARYVTVGGPAWAAPATPVANRPA